MRVHLLSSSSLPHALFSRDRLVIKDECKITNQLQNSLFRFLTQTKKDSSKRLGYIWFRCTVFQIYEIGIIFENDLLLFVKNIPYLHCRHTTGKSLQVFQQSKQSLVRIYKRKFAQKNNNIST